VQAVVVDKDGGVWVAGSSSSTFTFTGPNFPNKAERSGRSDAFVAKLRREPDGHTSVVYWTWIGGDEDEEVRAMALDATGRVYLTGVTTSTNFPLVAAFQTGNAGETDAFVTVIDPRLPAEEALVFSSYYGGPAVDLPEALAVEPSGATVIVGSTLSEELPGLAGNLQGSNRGSYDAFIARIEPGTGALRYSTFYGGGGNDHATGLAVDPNGIIWFTGYTFSTDFPLTGNGYLTQMRSSTDGFLAAVDPAKPNLAAHAYGSYIGGNDLDKPQRLAIDTDGTFWLAGYTFSTDFVTTADAYQLFNRGLLTNAFVAHLDLRRPPSEIVTYSSYLGGSFAEILYGMTPLADGRVAIAGYTMSSDYPSTGQPRTPPPGSISDAFVSVINTRIAGAPGLEYSTQIMGVYGDVATSLATDPSGGFYLAGYTSSNDLPVTDGSSRSKSVPLYSGFVFNFAPGAMPASSVSD
jgi:hypothetical protein